MASKKALDAVYMVSQYEQKRQAYVEIKTELKSKNWRLVDTTALYT